VLPRTDRSAGPESDQANILHSNAFPFTHGLIFGADPDGYDIFSRILYGGRVSLEVGFGAQAIGVAFGTTIGMSPRSRAVSSKRSSCA